MNVFSIIGIGPGSREYMLPRAWEEVKKTDTLLGSSRCLEMFRDTGTRLYPLGAEGQKEAVAYIQDHRETERIALLVAGDPGFHSYLTTIRRTFPPQDYRVIPGISSLQIAFARIGMPWHDAALLPPHGRDLSGLGDRPLFFLTDKTNTPRKIAGTLVRNGMEDRTVWVMENLSYPDERITQTRLSDLARDKETRALCVLIVE